MPKGRPAIHGASSKKHVHPTYRSWRKMIDRCLNPRHVNYHRYGGRGITICEEWKKDYAAFYRDMGDRPEGKSLDRIDNNLGYTPENCRWSSPKEQNRNTGKTVRYPFNGRLLRVYELVELTDLSEATLRARLREVAKGRWTLEEALNLPFRGRCAHSKTVGKRKSTGESYFIEGSIRSAAIRAGIRYGTVLYRVRHGGMTIQEAIECKPYSYTKTTREKRKVLKNDK